MHPSYSMFETGVHNSYKLALSSHTYTNKAQLLCTSNMKKIKHDLSVLDVNVDLSVLESVDLPGFSLTADCRVYQAWYT